MNKYRTHRAKNLNIDNLGSVVMVAGWVQTVRDHGGVIFIDLRDENNLVQVVFDLDKPNLIKQVHNLKIESIISVKGKVRNRPKGTINTNMSSGEIEIAAQEIDILSKALTLPFQLDDSKVSEEVRLRYRYLDLRTQKMQQSLRLRSKIINFFHSYLNKNEFLDIDTPILTKATPEGARDYLVPSRTHNGAFFALPQSPQLFKQLLMISGFEKYYQIVKCFRDEDLRADRQPEFTQLDLEMAFVEQDEILEFIQVMIIALFKDILNISLGDKIPCMSYIEAISKYGSDKPDLRNPLKLVDLKQDFKDTDFKVFSVPANSKDGRVVALKVPDGVSLTRKQIDDYTEFVAIYKAKGLAYIKVINLEQGLEGLQSPIIKFFPELAVSIIKKLGAKNGDLIFFGAGRYDIVNESMGALRVKLGQDLNLLTKNWSPLWIVDFPMFKRDLDTGKYSALHHPFTKPKIKELNPSMNYETILTDSYDLIINGVEIGGGSLRINDAELQQYIFKALNLSQEEINNKFGFFIDAMRYGCPPHGGIALGIDRLIMVMLNLNSIREVIPFPKTQSAACLLTEAPAEASKMQLKELKINIK